MIDDLMADVIAYFAAENELSPLRDAVREAGTWQQRLSAIRTLYRAVERLCPEFPNIEPYSLGLYELMTPIEGRLWIDIRSTGRLRFLPQYPVGRFFVDFGDPKRKIAIEADGKEFHDAAKDAERDQELLDKHGWCVFRVTGAETYRVLPSPDEFVADHIEQHDFRPGFDRIQDAARDFYMTTSTGVVRAIRDVLVDRKQGIYYDWQIASLDAHRLAKVRTF